VVESESEPRWERVAGYLGRMTARTLATLHVPPESPIGQVVKRIVLGLLMFAYWLTFPIRFPIRVWRELTNPDS